MKAAVFNVERHSYWGRTDGRLCEGQLFWQCEFISPFGATKSGVNGQGGLKTDQTPGLSASAPPGTSKTPGLNGGSEPAGRYFRPPLIC